MLVKFKFDDSAKVHEFELKPKDNIYEVQAKLVKQILNVEGDVFYHLFNPETQKFIEQTAELPKLKNSVLIMVDTSKKAQTTVEKLKSILNEKKINEGRLDTAKANELKAIAFDLKNSLAIDSFSEEFISYGGLDSLIESIQISTGNTRSYAINSLKSILVYKNAIEYIRVNSSVITNLYFMVMNASLNTNSETAIMSIISHTLGILFILCDLLKDEGVLMILMAAEAFSNTRDTKIFKELVMLINSNDMQIKINTMTLIFILVKCSKKSRQTKIICLLYEADLGAILSKNIEVKSEEFQTQLTNFQKVSGEVIKGSQYETQVYKSRYKDIENHCFQLEKTIEYILLNQSFYTDIVKSFIMYEKMAETAIEIGGYYDPSKLN